MPIWYVMDEFGCRIRHNDTPNFKVTPFFFAPSGCTFSLLFPVRNTNYGDEVTRDYLGSSTFHIPEWRQYYLLPWKPKSLKDQSIEFVQHDEDFFKTHREEEFVCPSNQVRPPTTDTTDEKLKVYSEYPKINCFLTHDKFEITPDRDSADILWLASHFKDFGTLAAARPNCFINQFPHEGIVTVKDLLAAVVHLKYQDEKFTAKTMDCQPTWLAVTYNLRTELPQFVAHFQRREETGHDNHWIIKPWNLARGLDTFLTKDLSTVIRSIETGPKIACKYLADPVLFHRSNIDAWVKFDLRFIVLLKSVQPLKAYVYDNFWLRFSNKSFSLEQLDDYEKHFTLMNYLGNDDKILQMFSKDFIDEFNSMYPEYSWHTVQDHINEVIKDSLEAATYLPPPRGICHNIQSRAMYGIDIMLAWSPAPEGGVKRIQPVLLEYNFMPDCERACDYYADFMNVVFETLFSSDDSERLKQLPVTLL